MIMTFFHTVLYILWIIILAAIAVIAVSIASVVVKVIFSDPKKQNDSDNYQASK